MLKIETRFVTRIMTPDRRTDRPLRTGRARLKSCIVLWTLLCSLGALILAAAPGRTAAASDRRETDPLAALPGIITAGGDRAIKRWDMSGKLACTVGVHADTINAIAIVPGSGGLKLVSVGSDGWLKVWNIQTATALASIDTHHGAVTALALSPDGRLAATGGTDDQIRLWNLANGHMLAEIKAHGDTVRALQFSRDGARLVSGSADRLIRIWRVGDNGKSLDYRGNILAHDDAVTGIVLPPDDEIASVSGDGYLKFWESDNGGLKNRVHVSARGVLAIAISPDGRTIATGDEDGKIHLWNAATGMPVAFMGSHDRAVCALAWAPDGATLVSGSEDKTVRYWNVAAGRQIARIAAHDGAVKAIVVLP